MKKSFSIILLILSSSGVFAQHNHLDKRISLQQSNLPLEEVIYYIGESADFQFSYNSSIVDGSRSVSVNADQEPVREVLDDLLGEGYRYKVVGNHVIILPDTKRQRVPKSECKQDYIITGYIVDSQSGEKIFEASIYEATNRLITATDLSGRYSLTLPCGNEERYLNFSKVGYQDTIIALLSS